MVQMRKRIRELGIQIGRFPTGTYNAITDVPGVRVGHETVFSGNGAQAARTGVTVILPNDDIYRKRIFGSGHVINGAGEMTGMIQVKEWGMIESPIVLTNSMNVGTVSDGVIAYMTQKYPEIGETSDVLLPIVGECDDSFLNDSRARHVRQQHVLAAFEKASDGEVEEGCVGSGTGMSCFFFKGGIGTSSRQLFDQYTIGALVMTNFGHRDDFLLDGIAVGREIRDFMPERHVPEGSIIIVLGTDAPFLPHQLNRISKRAALALGKMGSKAHHGSGEIVLTFSTGNILPRQEAERVRPLQMMNDEWLNPFFQAAIECVEEAVLNAMFMATTTTGKHGNTLHAIPIERTLEIMKAKGYFQ